MVVGKVMAQLCLTLIINELNFSVEHDRVVTALNTIKHIKFSVAFAGTGPSPIAQMQATGHEWGPNLGRPIVYNVLNLNAILPANKLLPASLSICGNALDDFAGIHWTSQILGNLYAVGFCSRPLPPFPGRPIHEPAYLQNKFKSTWMPSLGSADFNMQSGRICVLTLWFVHVGSRN